MRILGFRTCVLAACLGLAGVGILWAPSSLATERSALPAEGTTQTCPDHSCPPEAFPCPQGGEIKEVVINGLGQFQTTSTGGSPIVAVAGKHFFNRGLRTVPLYLASIDGTAFAEGIGETRFWLDASRPVEGAIWEKKPGTDFPAIQEVRFHFFFSVEAMPGKVYRSLNPAIMRADDLTAFPPAPGTRYRLVQQVQLEDLAEPGVIAGRVISNDLVMGGRR